MRAALRDIFGVTLAGRNFRVFLILTFVSGAIVGPFAPFLPVYVHEKLGTTQVFTAGIQTITLLLGAVFLLIGGAVSDSLGPKRALLLGALGAPLAAIVFLSGNFWVLIGLAVARGVTRGFGGGGSQTYLVVSAPANRLASATAIYFMGSTLGAAIGAPVAGMILESASYSLLGGIMLAASIPVALALLLLLDDVRAGATAERPRLRTVLSGYLTMLRRRHVVAFVAMQYLRTCFYGAVVLAVPFLIHSLSGSTVAVGWFSSISLIFATVAMFVVGGISDRIGRKRVVLASLPAIAVSSLMLAASQGSLAAMFVSGTFAIAAAWTLSGQMTPLAKEIAEEGEAGRMVGLMLFPHSLAMLTGALMHGFLTESHPELMFILLAAFVTFAWACGIFLFKTGSLGSPEGLVLGGRP